MLPPGIPARAPFGGMRRVAGGQVPYTRYPATVTGCQPNGDSNGPCATPEQVSDRIVFPCTTP